EIKNMDSIKDKKIKPVHKQLVANLNEQDIGKIDNIEGMTFGKQLPNGNDSLVLVTDNNFNQSQKTELIAFEVQPEDKSN
ncbi:esterase-like activity of phytase family protein, partial [Staphylococcus gallinarum]